MFTPPSLSDRTNALGNISKLPKPFQILLDVSNFQPISSPKSSDWLAEHSESGQTVSQFMTSSLHCYTKTNHIIYLFPLGNFSHPNYPSLDSLCLYTTQFFQTEVKLLPAYFPSANEFSPRSNPYSGQRQILASDILAFLKERLPSDAYCLMGVTMEDLYPRPSWNFVFGLANTSQRVGVFSFIRYIYDDLGRSQIFESKILQRSCKTLVHEILHMCGMKHCIFHKCCLNGSNHLGESDNRPQHLCSICLRKLSICAGSQFDLIKRYRCLAEFYQQNNWSNELEWVEQQLVKVST
jgi:archaemetzincin